MLCYFCFGFGLSFGSIVHQTAFHLPSTCKCRNNTLCDKMSWTIEFHSPTKNRLYSFWARWLALCVSFHFRASNTFFLFFIYFGNGALHVCSSNMFLFFIDCNKMFAHRMFFYCVNNKQCPKAMCLYCHVYFWLCCESSAFSILCTYIPFRSILFFAIYSFAWRKIIFIPTRRNQHWVASMITLLSCCCFEKCIRFIFNCKFRL